MARLKDYYLKKVVPALIEKFNYKNPMQVPKMKDSYQYGTWRSHSNIKIIDGAVQEVGSHYRAKTGNK